MIIEVEKLPDNPIILDCQVPWHELKFVHQDARLRQDVHFNARLTRTGDQTLRLEGYCRATIDLKCSRCLKVFQKPQSLEFDLNYLPHTATSRDGDEIELQYEDLELGFYDGVRLDTNIVLSEQLVFAVPMKPLCRTQCNGLCTQCGINLNLGQCGCEPEVMNPMRGQLMEFKRYLEEKKK